MLKVGKVTKAHGLRGEIFVHLFSGNSDWLQDVREIILSSALSPDQFLKYQIKKGRRHKTGVIFELENVTDRDLAEELVGSLFYLSKKQLVSDPGEFIFLYEIEGFEVIHSIDGLIGVISDFSSNGLQDIICVEKEGRVCEILFIEEFIERIDFEMRVVYMNFPIDLIRI